MQNSKCSNCGETREENFELCWNCGTPFEIINDNSPSDFQSEDLTNYQKNNSNADKINSAGKSLKSVARSISYFFLINTILIIVSILSNGIDYKFYIINGLVGIIMVVNIILELSNAGDQLLSISSIDVNEAK